MIALIGGTGYIGSHLARELNQHKLDFVIIDKNDALSRNIINSKVEVCDIQDLNRLVQVFQSYSFDSVIHLAGLKDARESNFQKPLYFQNNVEGTKNVLMAMSAIKCKQIIFSSTAAVYKESKFPFNSFTESADVYPSNYYGKTKMLAESQIQTFTKENNISAVIFRYFNVSGASFPTKIECIRGSITANLIDAVKNGRDFQIYGNEFPTPDGTSIRDYVHVADIISAHLLALNYLKEVREYRGVINLGSSMGFSVLEFLTAMIQVSGRPISHNFQSANSLESIYAVADNAMAKRILGWVPARSLAEICAESLENFY